MMNLETTQSATSFVKPSILLQEGSVGRTGRINRYPWTFANEITQT